MRSTTLCLTATLAGMIGFAVMPAQAALMLVTTETNDPAFEGPGGFLQTHYGLPLVNGSALPPLERAVGQLAKNNANGLYVPTPLPGGSGVPGVGAGVTSALTNHPLVSTSNGTGSTTGSFPNFGQTGGVTNGTPVAFEFKRTNTGTSNVTVSYTLGAKTWSSSPFPHSYYDDLNGLEFRIRSAVGTTVALTGLTYVAGGSTQSLLPISASNGAVLIKLFSGVAGNFDLTGFYTVSWTGVPANGWNTQIKGLDLPSSVPEPASLALFGLGLAALAAQRRRRA